MQKNTGQIYIQYNHTTYLYKVSSFKFKEVPNKFCVCTETLDNVDIYAGLIQAKISRNLVYGESYNCGLSTILYEFSTLLPHNKKIYIYDENIYGSLPEELQERLTYTEHFIENPFSCILRKAVSLFL